MKTSEDQFVVTKKDLQKIMKETVDCTCKAMSILGIPPYLIADVMQKAKELLNESEKEQES